MRILNIKIKSFFFYYKKKNKIKKKKKKRTSFIDIGCGNGLLTNLLTKEGFKGYGIDISKRKVWDIYDKDVKLEGILINLKYNNNNNNSLILK